MKIMKLHTQCDSTSQRHNFVILAECHPATQQEVNIDSQGFIVYGRNNSYQPHEVDRKINQWK